MLKAALVYLGLVVAGLAVVLVIVRLTPLWDRLLSPGEFHAVDFATLELTAKPNQFLICPPDLCAKAAAHRESPVFDRAVTDLRTAIEAIAGAGGDVTQVSETEDTVDFVVRTPLMRWPDWVTVQVIPVGDDRSTLAIYSRSVFGHSDLGANEKRIVGWLQDLR